MSGEDDSLSDSAGSRTHPRSGKAERVAKTDANQLIAVLLASLIGGGGVGIVLPKVAPGWYREDPAYGGELRALHFAH